MALKIVWSEMIELPPYELAIDPETYTPNKVRYIDVVVGKCWYAICARVFHDDRTPVSDEEMQTVLHLARIRYGVSD